MDREKAKRISERAFLAAVLLSFALAAVWFAVRAARGEEGSVLVLLQCLCGILGAAIPAFASKSGWLRAPRTIRVLYLAFLFSAVFLAEVCGFYDTVPHWDTALHVVSAGLFATAGFSAAAHFAGEDAAFRAAGLTAVFAFCFALALGGLWEFYEFAADSILGTNMQRFRLPDGALLSGRDALWDTMKDLLADAFGAAAVSAGGYASLKRGGRMRGMLIRFGRRERETRLEGKERA